MNSITAIVRDGVIVPSEPIEWPDGTRVEVTTFGYDGDPNDLLGDSPEAVERWLAEFRSIPPLVMTPEEEEEWIAERKAQRAYDASKAVERDEKLRKMFE